MPIELVCDCGCGRMAKKQPNKLRSTYHNFYSKECYYRWMKKNKRIQDTSARRKVKYLFLLRKELGGVTYEEQ